MPFPYGSIKAVPDAKTVRIVISKKIAAKAVDRNRLRRRIRAIIREVSSRQSGFAVYPNKTALGASFAELTQAFKSVLR